MRHGQPLRGAAAAAIAVAIALAVIDTLVSGWTFFKARDTVWESLEQSAMLQARGLAIAVSDDLAVKNYGAMESRIRQTMANPTILSALVTDMSGKVLSHQRRATDQSEPKLVFDAPPVLPQPDVDTSHLETSQDDRQVTRWARIDVGQQLGWTQIKVSTGAAERTLDKLRQETFLLATLGILTGVTMLFVLLRRIFSQVRSNETLMLAEQHVLEEEAHHDHLTGLANRYLLMDRVQQAINRSLRGGEALAVCMLDLDGFKAVNDQHGHAVGDLLLREVAHRLIVCVRSEETVARLGGDEFVLLLEQIKTVEGCELVLQRVLDAINQPISINGQEVKVGVSIGVTYFPRNRNDDRGGAALLAEADQAMYDSKRAGRNRWQAYVDTRPEQASG